MSHVREFDSQAMSINCILKAIQFFLYKSIWEIYKFSDYTWSDSVNNLGLLGQSSSMMFHIFMYTNRRESSISIPCPQTSQFNPTELWTVFLGPLPTRFQYNIIWNKGCADQISSRDLRRTREVKSMSLRRFLTVSRSKKCSSPPGLISRVSTVGPKAGVPVPVAFPLSLPKRDRASSVSTAWVFWPGENLGPKRG